MAKKKTKKSKLKSKVKKEKKLKLGAAKVYDDVRMAA